MHGESAFDEQIINLVQNFKINAINILLYILFLHKLKKKIMIVQPTFKVLLCNYLKIRQ